MCWPLLVVHTFALDVRMLGVKGLEQPVLQADLFCVIEPLAGALVHIWSGCRVHMLTMGRDLISNAFSPLTVVLL